MAVTDPVPSRERVRRAALKLFATRGFHGTGIRDLAQEARLSPASLYHYMGTKEALLAELMRESLQTLLDSARATVADVTDPRERLRRLVALHVTTHATQPDETRVVDNEVRSLSPEPRAAVIRLRDTYEALWADAIDDGVRAGIFHTDEPSVSRLALLEMCNGVARWYSPRGALSLEQLSRHYARLALGALGAGDAVEAGKSP
ncbi:transcriptional regulator, TetR family [Amycolatopsis marina]|uniref:Transcriptional regulator, TetR family n=1 Tax=Amycolatopsis marina TaxID=490629 RepID=A0A1I1BEW0_9PSEU|nr:TetR/AcrR family transcriptional regulator [Amycolatopsis marina]SFB48667.1 transcriptional regulator, TetR family [Amycolatopsis marina]